MDAQWTEHSSWIPQSFRRVLLHCLARVEGALELMQGCNRALMNARPGSRPMFHVQSVVKECLVHAWPLAGNCHIDWLERRVAHYKGRIVDAGMQAGINERTTWQQSKLRARHGGDHREATSGDDAQGCVWRGRVCDHPQDLPAT